MIVILLYTLISFKPLKYKNHEYPTAAYGTLLLIEFQTKYEM